MSFTDLLNLGIQIDRKMNLGNNVTPNYQYIPVIDTTGVLNQLKEDKIIRNEGGKILADYQLYIDYNANVTNNETQQYRVKIGDKEFSVYRVHNPNEMDRHLEIFMRLEQQGSEVLGS